MRKINNKDSLILSVIFLWGIIITVRLVELQLFQHDFFSKLKRIQTRAVEEIIPRRGTIYDREGEILAISIPSFSAYVRKELTPEELEELKSALNLSIYQIRSMVKRWKKGKKFTWIKRKLTEKEYKKVKALKIGKIEFIEESRRVYPNGRLASHILGGVGIDGRGLAGIEYSMEKTIGGTHGKEEILLDGLGYPIDIKNISPVKPGQDLKLTIDASLQHMVEKYVRKRVKEVRAKRGTAMILNLKGEVLAMASYPDFDPNFYTSTFNKNNEAFINFGVSLNYEPGSTIKFVDMASALEEGVAKPDEKIFCGNGKIEISGVTIKDHLPFGLLSIKEILIYSSNVGTIKMVARLKNEVFYEYLKKFGLGERTGIELPGEAEGWIPSPKKWGRVTKAYYSIGQGFAISPIQMASAVLSIADGGVWRQPHITFRSNIRERKVISAKVAREVRDMMKGVVEFGTGKKASVGWIPVGGKTGTPEKIIGKSKKFTPTFVGFLPYRNPKYVIVVVIDEPKRGHYGGDVAAPVFREISEYLLMKENLYPAMVME